MTHHLPLFLAIHADRRILIAGGGNVASGKVEALLPHAAYLHVVAPVINPRLRILLQAHNISFEETDYTPAHLQKAGLVIAATDDRALNERIHADASQKGILVNSVDAPQSCDMIFPAIIRRGELQVAISSGGASPVLARLIKQRIERILPWNLERLVEFARTNRALVQRAFATIQQKRLFWQHVLEGPIAEDILEGNLDRAARQFKIALGNKAKTGRHAALYLIGAGPGHPELITVKGVRLLAQADVVLYDSLTPPQLLDQYTRREAEKICVGKRRNLHHLTQEQIDALIEEKLLAGLVVVRLKGGDPGIFAHGAEEVAVARRLSIPYQIVPGISAANGCAAYAGIPLTARDSAHSVRFMTLYKETLQDKAFWKNFRASQQETLVFYMSAVHNAVLCERLLKAGLAADTPVLAVEQGTTPSHREFEAPLSQFAERYRDHAFASPTLLIIGNVVAWRAQHAWKQQAPGNLPFFGVLKEEGHVRH